MCDALHCFYFDKTPKEFYKDMTQTRVPLIEWFLQFLTFLILIVM